MSKRVREQTELPIQVVNWDSISDLGSEQIYSSLHGNTGEFLPLAILTAKPWLYHYQTSKNIDS